MPAKAVFETALTDHWTATAGLKIGDKPGDVRWEGNKCYKCVIYSKGIPALAQYGVVGYITTTGYAAHTVSDDVSACSEGAGVAMSAPADGEYFWIMIKGGPITLNVDTVSGAAGNGLCLSTTTDATLKVCAAADQQCAVCVAVPSPDVIICDFPF